MDGQYDESTTELDQ